MAELEARFDDPKIGRRLLWQNVLPDDREVSIGRNPLTQADVPPENRAEWITDPRDTFVSGCHAYVRWDGDKLQVRIRTVPKRPTNPIFFQREPKDSFAVSPGQAFTIGNTTFFLHSGEALGAATDEDEANPLQVTQFKLNPTELRQIVFHDTSHILKAMSRFPGLVRYSRDDATRDDNLLKLITESLRQADVAALLRADERSKEFRVAVQQVHDKRPRREAGLEFRPSAKLSKRALLDMENTLHVRGQTFDSKSADVTFDAGVDWAICTPLVKDGPFRLGLYVAGHLPPAARTDDVPPELRDYLKVTALAAQIYESAYELRRAEAQLTRYQGFLSRNVVTLLNTANADELLKPKETDVSVLFCDLRGSCKLAEQGAEDLLGNWNRISQALDVMTTAITDEGGVIGDLQGDAAMGFWGWPLAQPDQVQRAARAALRIQRDFARGKAGQNGYVCGIGLAHGKAVAGRLGTSDQIKLDVFGPVVNLAARLEGLTKYFGVSILADERIGEGLIAGDPPGLYFQTRQLGRVRPAGMDRSTTVYEVTPPGEFSDRQKALWDAATKSFVAGRFTAVRDKLDEFSMTGGRATTDRVAELLTKLMEPHGERGPEGWDGVIRPESK